VINAHRDMALWTLFGLAFTGGASWIVLWRYRSRGPFPRGRSSNPAVLRFSPWHHDRNGTPRRSDQSPRDPHGDGYSATDANAGISSALETLMKDMVWFVPWQNRALLWLLPDLRAVSAVVLRVLGFGISTSFAAMHQLAVLGFLECS